MEYFTKEGMIKFVAFQLLDNPPDGELEQHMVDDDSVWGSTSYIWCNNSALFVQ